MEKLITITLPEKKARTLMDHAYSMMQEFDHLDEEKKTERTKRTADVLNEVFEDLRDKIHT